MADLRQRIFEHELALPLPRHAQEEGGRMLSRITYEVAQVSEAVSTAWIILVRDSLVLVGLMGFLFYTAWELTLQMPRWIAQRAQRSVAPSRGDLLRRARAEGVNAPESRRARGALSHPPRSPRRPLPLTDAASPTRAP